MALKEVPLLRWPVNSGESTPRLKSMIGPSLLSVSASRKMNWHESSLASVAQETLMLFPALTLSVNEDMVHLSLRTEAAVKS